MKPRLPVYHQQLWVQTLILTLPQMCDVPKVPQLKDPMGLI